MAEPPAEAAAEPPQEKAEDPTPEVREIKIDEKIASDMEWENYIDEYNSTGKSHFEAESREAPKFESFVAGKKTLEDHLLWQLLMAKPTEIEERVGSIIIGNISRDGYLDISVEEIATLGEVSVEEAEEGLALMQSFDPVGVCARDLSECLLIQIRALGTESHVLERIVTDHIKHLENKNYKAICRALKVNLDAVVAAVGVIKGLEPKPGRKFNEEEPHYITPDIYVHKTEEGFSITLNDDGMPRLHINPYYRKAVSRGEKIPASTKEYLQDKMRSASWLIKSIHQRQKTIYNVMESIIKFQRDFFEKGIAHLKPLVLRDVAEDIGMHESTISRVTTNKYAFTPQGIFELKYFFNSSINRVYGSAIASASVQDKIKQIIAGEDPKKPLSDEKIAKILEDSNVKVARRTVAKYREILKILPSNKRKQF